MPRDTGDFIKIKGPRKAPRGQRFLIFGRVSKKYYGGNAWQGLHNMKKDIDWHVIKPAMVTNILPEGVGWIYRIKKELKHAVS